jgi:hypothetical protein
MIVHTRIKIGFGFRFRIACLCFTRCAIDFLLDGLDIFENKFRVDDLNIPFRINRAVNMNNILIVEAANDMENGIDIANM